MFIGARSVGARVLVRLCSGCARAWSHGHELTLNASVKLDVCRFVQVVFVSDIATFRVFPRWLERA